MAYPIADDGVTVLTEIVAGTSTWYLFLFGQEVTGLEIQHA